MQPKLQDGIWDKIMQSYGKRNAVKGEFLVRIRPTNIIAQKDMVG